MIMKYDAFKAERNSHLELGKIYLWTVTINKWQKLLQDDNYKDIIINSIDFLTTAKKIDVFAFVIMPNHIHLILRLINKNGKEYPHTSFLKFTSHEFKKLLLNNNSGILRQYFVNVSNKNYEFWQRDSLGIHLFSDSVAYQKLDYIHANPTTDRWRFVTDPCNYKYSSARFYELGIKEFKFIKDLRNEF
jgi:putative transposase